jgi:transposase
MASRAGRPSKLSRPVRDRLIEALTTGAYREAAATYAGIHVATLYRWLERGDADIKQGLRSEFRELCEAVKGAEAEFQLRALRQIDAAAERGAWQASAWRLERKHPDSWGRKRAVEVVTSEMMENLMMQLEKEVKDLEEELGEEGAS